MSRKRLTIVGLAVALLLTAGIAYASIPGPDGVIHGCYKNNNPAQGAVIAIDSAASCPSGYTALNWPSLTYQPVYYARANTADVPAGTDFGNRITVRVSCDSGDIASGGGFQVQAGGDDVVVADSIADGSAGLFNGWEVQAFNPGTTLGRVATWTICTRGVSSNQP